MTKKALSIPVLLLAAVLVAEVYFGWSPKTDRATWFMENLPVFLVIPVLLRFHPRLKLTTLTLSVLALHALVLMVGGHYSYAMVPLGAWFQDALELKRNHYDRLGHFMQGFGPAVALRELIFKTTILKRGWFLSLVVFSMCLAFSSFYEMIEWWTALIMGQGAEAFLGTQGDIWDTQWDMFMCLVGALSALLLFAKWQDSQIARGSFVKSVV
jgi:putative membrane protein